MATKTEEQKQVADAPVVENTVTSNGHKTVQEKRAAVEAEVTALFAEQFGGEDGAPAEGVTPWDPMVREQVIEADKLETLYRDTLTKKEFNRTLIRSFAGMNKVPQVVADYYYPERDRRAKNSA